MIVTVISTCTNYFTSTVFNKLRNFSKNNARENALAILQIFSYFTLFIPLIFAMTYGISSLLNRVTYNTHLSQTEINTSAVAQRNLLMSEPSQDLSKLTSIFKLVSSDEPVIGTAKKGLNLEGKCQTENCQNFGKLVMIPRGIADFFVNKECFHACCPECKKPIGSQNVNTIGLSGSKFQFRGRNEEKKTITGIFQVPANENLRLNVDKCYYVSLVMCELT